MAASHALLLAACSSGPLAGNTALSRSRVAVAPPFQRAWSLTALRAGGTLCPCPTGPRQVGLAGHAVDELPPGAQLPRLIVFDLDNTLWTPELYTLRHLAGYAAAAPPGPEPNKDVWLVDGALDVLSELATSARWKASGVLVAAASRTNKGPWARSLLSRMEVPVPAGHPPAGRLSELLALVEIRPGSKRQHFERLQQASGVPYNQMLFFDDARDGAYGNCEPVSALGVLSVHTPRGLTRSLFASALREFAARKAAGATTAVVLPLKPGAARAGGAATREQRGADAAARAGGAPAGDARTRLRCFSMNPPFAPLLARGIKTVETRNGSMFAGSEGEVVLLHCGRRPYPDGGEHRQVLAEAGMSAAQVAEATSLPPAFAPGQLIAIVRLGRTVLVADERARSRPEVERSVVARGGAMGRYHTTIAGVAWLSAGVPLRGQPGLFSAEVPTELIPAEARAWLAAPRRGGGLRRDAPLGADDAAVRATATGTARRRGRPRPQADDHDSTPLYASIVL